MKTDPDLLDALRDRGFTLAFSDDGGRILVTPAKALTEEDRQAIKGQRDALLDALAWEAAPDVSGHEPDWSSGPVQMLALAVVRLDGCEPVTVEAERWERFKALLEAHNAAAREAWVKHCRKSGVATGSQAKQTRKRSQS